MLYMSYYKNLNIILIFIYNLCLIFNIIYINIPIKSDNLLRLTVLVIQFWILIKLSLFIVEFAFLIYKF